jgi:hypothetical protein
LAGGRAWKIFTFVLIQKFLMSVDERRLAVPIFGIRL